MRRLIVGYDERAEGVDALALAHLLADEGGAQATVVNVTPDDSFWMGRAEFERTRESDAARISRQAQTALGGAAVETRVMASGRSPARILTELAEDEGTEAIVIGSTLHGPLGRVLFGSTGERLLNGAPCAVAVAPRGYAATDHGRPTRIGVAYDGEPESRLALQEARELAAASGAALRLLTVVPGRQPEAAGDEYFTSLKNDLQRCLDAGLAGARREGLDAEGRLLTGDPAEILTSESADGLDLLFVGSRGYGPLRRTLLGGVSATLMRSASCPVLVVPRSSGESSERVVERHHQRETADQAD